MNDDAMSKYRTYDGSTLTPAQIARLDEVEARLGDCDNIPEISDAAWATAVRGRFARAATTPVAIRLDAHLVAWLNGQGPDIDKTINRILREKMLAELAT